MSRDPAEATSARHQASAGTTAPTGAESRPAGRRATHEVLNQPPPLQDTASFSDDAMLYVYAGDGMFEGENTYLIPALLEEDVDEGIERGYFADYQFATASPYYVNLRSSLLGNQYTPITPSILQILC